MAPAAAALLLYSRLVEPRLLDITRVEIALERWPVELDGIRLALVADLHVGRQHGRDWTCPSLESAVKAVAAEPVDMLVFDGDFGYKEWEPDHLASIADSFGAPLRIAVLGNHDYGAGSGRADRLSEALTRKGFCLLRNQVIQVAVRGRSIWVAGLDDGATGRACVPELLDSIPENACPVILVSHTPDSVASSPAGVFDLALSGHTHGGQIAIPFLTSLTLRRTARTGYNRGLYRVNGIPLFVTKGLGMVGYHARFRSRPEVAFLTLRHRAVE